MFNIILGKASRLTIIHNIPDKKNALWVMIGQFTKVIMQSAFFILIARMLGVKGYGAFVGVVALVSIFAPYSSLGTGNLLIKHVSRSKELFDVYWGKVLLNTVWSGLFVGLLVVLISRYLLPHSISLLLVIFVTFSDILFARIFDMCIFAFMAVDRLGLMAFLQTLASLTRLAAASILILITDSTTPENWGFFYMVGSFLCMVVGLLIVTREMGGPRFNWQTMFHELREGSLFAVSLSAQGIYNDIDKTMVSKLSTLESSGIYAAAYRIVDVSFTPIRSLLISVYSKFFRTGKNGILDAYSFSKKLLPASCLSAFFISLCLFFAAPVLPLIIGETYQNAVIAVRWLALLPLLKTVHYFLADTLTGAGHQGKRTLVQIGVAVANILLNLIIIPAYSWIGAAWVSIISDALLAISLWIILLYSIKREKNLRHGVDLPS